MAIKPIISHEQQQLLKAQMLLKAFSDLQSTMPIQVAQTFLLVAIHDGCSLTDLMKRTGWAQSTLSRHLLDLGERNRHKLPGLDLIESRRDPMELRKNIYTLSPAGQRLAHEVLSLLDLGANYGNLSRQEVRQNHGPVES